MALYSAPPVGKGSKATCPAGFSIPNKVVNGARSASLGTHCHVPFADNKQGSNEVMVKEYGLHHLSSRPHLLAAGQA